MRLSVIQMNVGADKTENIDQANKLICAALENDAPSMIALPEMWSCLGGSFSTKFRQAESLPPFGSNALGGDAYEFLRQTAHKNRIYVHGGSIAERINGRLFNTSVIFNPEGKEVARYQKLHLFDIMTNEGIVYQESKIFAFGQDIVTYVANETRVGCAICYDIRFPELFLALRRAGAILIILPAAFTVTTGRDHWEVLLRARAIETQCWLAAPATWGQHSQGDGGDVRLTYGHSLICDPWGRIVCSIDDGIGYVTAAIDLDVTNRVRRHMPIMEHRRIS